MFIKGFTRVFNAIKITNYKFLRNVGQKYTENSTYARV